MFCLKAAEQMLSALRTMCAQSTDDLKKTGAGRKSGIIEACAKIKTVDIRFTEIVCPMISRL